LRTLSFVSIWETTTANETITIPLTVIPTSVVIDWGDGSPTETITSANPSHQYATAGEYTISIDGESTLVFNNSGDKNKIKEITVWGNNINLTDGSFFGCSNLTLNNVFGTPKFTQGTSLSNVFWGALNLTLINNIESWDISKINNMNSMFRFSFNFNDRVGVWDVSNVQDFSNMFAFNSIFDQDLSGWSTSSMNSIETMFIGCTNFNNGGATGIGDWNVSNVSSLLNVFLDCTNFNQPIGGWDTLNVSSMSSCFQGANNFNQDLSKWRLDNCNDTSFMFYQANNFNNGGATGIGDWNTSNVTNMQEMFFQSAINQPLNGWDVGKVQNMNSMFRFTPFNGTVSNWSPTSCTNFRIMFGNTSFNQDIGNWRFNENNNVDMFGMFISNSSFNNGGQPTINDWNTSRVISMGWMFRYCTNFNQPIGNWDVSNVTDMQYMFEANSNFNQDLSTWNLQNVSNMTYMFINASSFNNGGATGIGDWRFPNVTSLIGLFNNCTNFDQPLSDWEVGNIQNFQNMFLNTSFNNGGQTGIGNWDVSSATNFRSMFSGTPFNQPIGDWIINTSSNVNMFGMFTNTPFNQPIGNWDTSRVTDMGWMFLNSRIPSTSMFNQPIGNWDVSNVTNFDSMFNGAVNFDQDLGAGGATGVTGTGWNIASATNLNNMFLNATLSVTNYDSLLLHWASHPDTPNSLTFHGGNSQYSSNATSARNYLTELIVNGGKGWTITDAGQI